MVREELHKASTVFSCATQNIPSAARPCCAEAAYRGDISWVKVWGFFQKGQAWVWVHHILRTERNPGCENHVLLNSSDTIGYQLDGKTHCLLCRSIWQSNINGYFDNVRRRQLFSVSVQQMFSKLWNMSKPLLRHPIKMKCFFEVRNHWVKRFVNGLMAFLIQQHYSQQARSSQKKTDANECLTFSFHLALCSIINKLQPRFSFAGGKKNCWCNCKRWQWN